MIHDENERKKALDPTKSFIVQAPAGSGKTELLTQRFLVLLGLVKHPEEILAITFTKKSALEMRTRIILALNNALAAETPSAPHAKVTFELAKKVIMRDKHHQWNLLDNPNRLRIQTIDSFNAYLTRQLPILSNFGAMPEITEDYRLLYKIAVNEFLSHLEENVSWADNIAELLLHLDNDLNKVADLLMNMLAKRDQWISYITTNEKNEKNGKEENLKVYLEKYLASVSEEILLKLSKLFPKLCEDETLYLLRYAASHLKNESPESPIVLALNLDHFPKHSLKDKNYWEAIIHLFLTKEGEWRKRVDKSLGFPASAFFKNNEERKIANVAKERCLHLINNLSENHALKVALLNLKTAPAPQYTDTQWKTLKALHQILIVLVAQLKVTFQQQGKIDYIENAAAALLALGTDENPTDLTLSLDYQIQHLLIDEFQDTSNSQYRLIERLIISWNPEENRTLFVVGDPMQSIYRFREAEVGLFIQTRQKGLNHLALHPLTLKVNFRSTAGIVNWVNKNFKIIFPTSYDINLGAVTYSESIAALNSAPEPSQVFLHSFTDEEEPKAQAYLIVNIIQEFKTKHPNKTIAILVRGRTHLTHIIPVLKKTGIRYRALDIDPLASRPVIQDLMALTYALCNPHDRIAWLSLLRAPWAGLSLSDLWKICFNAHNISIYEQLLKDQIVTSLSNDGQTIIKRILPILKKTIENRERFPFRAWIEDTWKAIGGPASVQDKTDLSDANAYFLLLQKLDNANHFLALDRLPDYLNKLYASPDNEADNSLQIMTIHNSKGLEFDCVILPHLEKKALADEKQLLLWLECSRSNLENTLILAPLYATGESSDTIYEYVKKIHALKTEHEMVRLLYVAVTRAKQELHLLFNLDSDKKNPNKFSNPPSKSLLEKLWPSIKTELINETSKINIKEKESIILEPKQIFLKRLNPSWQHPLNNSTLPDIFYHQKKESFLLPNLNAQYIGTVIHLILQEIATQGLHFWQEKTLELQQKYIFLRLKELRMPQKSTPLAIPAIMLAIQNTLEDPQGKWILEPHPSAQNEWRLTTKINNQIQNLIVDRTFVTEDGVRWIIDYKTTQLVPNQDTTTFLMLEQQKHAEKMSYYAAALSALSSHKLSIRLGLYFPLMPLWCDWLYIENNDLLLLSHTP